jgi:steroid delta-isomerase-like uncharacterized protein
MSDERTTVGTPSEGDSGMTREEIVAFFQHRQRSYEDLDAAALARDYAEDAVIESPTAGTHSGRAAAEQNLRAVFDAFLDLKVRPESLLIDGDHVCQTLQIEGSNAGGLFGLPPTGKSFVLTAAFFYQLRARQIVREQRIYDFTGLLLQTGVLKAKPA